MMQSLAVALALLVTTNDIADSKITDSKITDSKITDSDARNAVDESLGSSTRAPWYDADTGKLKPLPVSRDTRDARHRGSGWEYEVKPRKTSSNWGNAPWLNSVLNVIGIVVFAALIIGLVALLVWAFLQRDHAPESTMTHTSWTEEDRKRVENLPFDVARTEHNLRMTARTYYEQGDFGQAIVFLFSHQLVYLDRSHLIRLTRGKTNRQYLWDLRRRTELCPLLEQTMFAFEDFFFGRHQIERSRFEACWRELDRWETAVDAAAQATGVALA